MKGCFEYFSITKVPISSIICSKSKLLSSIVSVADHHFSACTHPTGIPL